MIRSLYHFLVSLFRVWHHRSRRRHIHLHWSCRLGKECSFEGNNLIFAGSVSHPQTDEYIPLVITLSNFGDVNISLDTQMDTNGDEENQNR